MSEYLILAPHKADSDLLVFYREDLDGLTKSIESAGRFSAERVRSMPGVYDNGKDAVAIPVDEVMKQAQLVVASVDRARLEQVKGN